MGGAVRLVPLAERHLAAVAVLVDDPDVQRFTRVPVPPPADFATTWLARYEQGRVNGTREVYAVEDPADASFLGVAVLPWIDRESATAELGYMVAPAARGRGVATAAIRQLVAICFAELGMERLELLISIANLPSKAVAERCGFTYEGTLRSTFVKPGLREDMEIWGRLPIDPEPE